MAWSTPEVREVCVGMEVTSYLSAEMYRTPPVSMRAASSIFEYNHRLQSRIANPTIVVIEFH